MYFKSLAAISVILFVSGFVKGQHDHQHHNHEEHRVNVDVYYESLCPDSRKFFTQQLYPSLQGNLSNYVNLTLIPYGKSTHTSDLMFTCHHGPGECQGNKIQACALRLIDNGLKTPGLGFNRVAAGFINCVMDKAVRNGDNATFPTKQCAEVNNVPNLSNIENCAGHTDGLNYLANYGGMTQKLQNPLQSVPTIVFNRNYKKEDSTLAQINFVRALCQYIHGEKPMECSSAVKLNISLGMVALVSLMSKIFYY